MNKKIAILSLVFLALIVAGGFWLWQYNEEVAVNPENQENNPVGGVEIISENESGLVICSDKCGDGICQSSEEKCDNLNCICQEDKQECPQDCK